MNKMRFPQLPEGVPNSNSWIYSPESAELEHEIERISRELIGWYSTYDSDSLSHQEFRRDGFIELAKYIEDYYLKTLDANLALHFKAGDQRIAGLYFHDGGSSIYDSDPVILMPGDSIPITKLDYVANSPLSVCHKPPEFYSRRELYVGSPEVQISLSTLAKTLAEGGKLELVD